MVINKIPRLRVFGWSTLAALLSLSAFSQNAGAVLITAGQSFPTTGTGTFSGTKIYDVTTPFVSSTGSFTGSLEAQVYSEASGSLDFVYQFLNNANSLDPILTFSASDFKGFTTNADDFLVVPTDVQPQTVSRTPATGPDAGGVILFDFGGGVAAGSLSDLLIIQTNATQVEPGNVSIQDGGQAVVATLAPAVPEPATFGMLTLAISGLFVRRNRSRR